MQPALLATRSMSMWVFLHMQFSLLCTLTRNLRLGSDDVVGIMLLRIDRHREGITKVSLGMAPRLIGTPQCVQVQSHVRIFSVFLSLICISIYTPSAAYCSQLCAGHHALSISVKLFVLLLGGLSYCPASYCCT